MPRRAEKWTRPPVRRSSGGTRSIWASPPRGGTPWPGVPSFVVTHRARPDLRGDNGGVFAFEGMRAAVRRAKQAVGDKDVLVPGADVARQMLRVNLLDEVRIHLVPLLLGGGTPLFAGEPAELVPEGKPVAGTVIHLRFGVVRGAGCLT